MASKWNDKAGNSLYVFAGNYMDGRVLHTSARNDSLATDEIIDNLLDNVGWKYGIWATYDARNPFEACESDFYKFMAWRKEKECA